MSDTPEKPAESQAHDYRATLFLPATDFPMKAGLPEAEPKWLARWAEMDLYGKLRDRGARAGRCSSCMTARSMPMATSIPAPASTTSSRTLWCARQGMLGKDAPYVPGWDCHGLPIEWKVEEKFRAEGKAKDDIPKDRAAPRMPRLRRPLAECAARADQAAGPDRRFRAALHHHEFQGRGGDRARGA